MMAKTTPTVEAILQRVPPHDEEAEASVLGAIFCDSNALDIAADLVTPEDFYLERHRVVFATMLELHERREPVDLVMLTHLLRESGQLQKAGGATALSEMMNTVPTAAHVVSYAGIVRTKAIQRRVIEESLRTAMRANDPVTDVATFLADAETRIAAIASEHTVPVASTAAETIIATLKRLDGRDADRIPTGYPTLDQNLGGFLRGSLVVVGARPGTGKSIFATDLALRGAIQAGIPALQHSLEMSREELMLRVLANRCSIRNWQLQRGMQHPADSDAVNREIATLAKLPWFIRDGATSWPQDLRAYERVVRDHRVGILIVDHVGLIRGVEGAGMMRRDLVIGEITAGLLGFARRHRVVVVLISQLNRASEKEQREPGLHDLRDSGSLEQDASIVLFLHAPDKQSSGDDEQRLDVIVAKNRQGPTGTFQLSYLKQFCRIIDPAAIDTDPYDREAMPQARPVSVPLDVEGDWR